MCKNPGLIPFKKWIPTLKLAASLQWPWETWKFHASKMIHLQIVGGNFRPLMEKEILFPTTWHIENLVNHGIFTISTGDRRSSEPSTGGFGISFPHFLLDVSHAISCRVAWKRNSFFCWNCPWPAGAVSREKKICFWITDRIPIWRKMQNFCLTAP